MRLLRLASPALGAALVLAHALLDAACVTSEEGVRVDVVARSPEPVASTSFVTDRGYTVVLSRAHASLGAIELLPCAGSAFAPFRTRRAYAHGSNSPTKLTTPAVLDLLGTAQSLALGELAPPARTYCSARVTLLAADDDALGNPDASDLGRSAVIEGTWTRAGDAPTPFAVKASLSADAEHEVQLDLSKPRQLTLVVQPTASRWFDGIDFATEDSASIERKVVNAIATSMSVSTP